MSSSTTILATLVAFVSGAFFATMFARLASGIGFTDNPDEGHKQHDKATPLLGGLAVICALVLSLWLFRTSWDAETAYVIGAAALMCGLGLIDDKFALRARTKFAGQLAICLPLSLLLTQDSTVHAFGWDIDLGYAMTALVGLWLLTTTNAVNLLDGLDGMVGSVSTSICLTLSGLALLTTGSSTSFLASAQLPLILGASLLGFLLVNWHPAKMYLGDAGSLSIGLLLGISVLKVCRHGDSTDFPTMVMVFAVPLIDLICAMARRVLRGTSIATADREHLHHRLARCGLSVPQVALFAAAVSGFCGIAAIGGTLLETGGISVAFCVLIFAGLAMGGFFGDEELVLLANWARVRLTGIPLLLANSRVTPALDSSYGRSSEEEPYRPDILRFDAATASSDEVLLYVRSQGGAITQEHVRELQQMINRLPGISVERIELLGASVVDEGLISSSPDKLQAAA